MNDYPTAIPPMSRAAEACVVDPEPNTVRSQLDRLIYNLDRLQKVVQLLHEHTAGYQKLPDAPLPGGTIAPAVDGTSAAHDNLNHINGSLEAEIDRLHSLDYRLDL